MNQILPSFATSLDHELLNRKQNRAMDVSENKKEFKDLLARESETRAEQLNRPEKPDRPEKTDRGNDSVNRTDNTPVSQDNSDKKLDKKDQELASKNRDESTDRANADSNSSDERTQEPVERNTENNHSSTNTDKATASETQGSATQANASSDEGDEASAFGEEQTLLEIDTTNEAKHAVGTNIKDSGISTHEESLVDVQTVAPEYTLQGSVNPLTSESLIGATGRQLTGISEETERTRFFAQTANLTTGISLEVEMKASSVALASAPSPAVLNPLADLNAKVQGEPQLKSLNSMPSELLSGFSSSAKGSKDGGLEIAQMKVANNLGEKAQEKVVSLVNSELTNSTNKLTSSSPGLNLLERNALYLDSQLQQRGEKGKLELIEKFDASLQKTNRENISTPGLSGLTNPSSLMSHTGARVQMPVNISFGQSGWANLVAERSAMMASQNIKFAELQLDPPELGPLQVKVTVNQDQQATVTFVAANSQVREALDQTAMRLREMLGEQGIDLLDVNVSDQSAQEEAEDTDSGSGESGAHAEEEQESEITHRQTITLESGIDHFV